MIRTRVGVVTAVIATMIAVLPAAGAIATPVVDHADLELQLIDLVNEERAANDLDPLEVYWDLADDARSHTDVMVDSNWLHHNPDLATVTTGWWRLGENVGYAPSAAILHDAWMASPGHRANILGDFNYIGVGVVVTESGQVWGTQVFMKGGAGINVPPASPARSIQGTIRDIDTELPLSGVAVTAYDRDGAVAATATTDEYGIYWLTGLAPDYYRVGAGEGAFYPEAEELASADPISAILDGDALGVDMAIVGNHAPAVTPVETETLAETSTDIDLLAVDPEGDPMTFAIDDAELAGTLTGSGPSVAFLPAEGFVGITTFSYTASDGEATSPSAVVTITVVDPAGPPPDVVAVVEGDVSGDGLVDVVHVDGSMGFWVAASSGSSLGFQRWADPVEGAAWAEFVSGDFDGNGVTDVAGFDENTGRWWVLRSDGYSFSVESWAQFGTKTGWTRRLVGDFNDDGFDDIANYHPNLKRWWVSLSTGAGFSTVLWAQFGTGSGWSGQLVGDFNDDGFDDIANFHPAQGRWWVSISTGTGFTTTMWDQLGAGGTWVNHVVGDFNGDAIDDVAVFNEVGGEWMVSLSGEAGFTTSVFAGFGTHSGWTVAVAGDFDDDGVDDIANYHPALKRWWISISTGSAFSTRMWAEFGTGAGWGPHLVGDYNGDEVPDVANFHPALGRWWISVSHLDGFTTTKWAEIGPTTPF